MGKGKAVNKERKALILAEATMLGKQEAASRNSVGVRTIYNWEQELAGDNELAELCREKQTYLQFRWIEKLPPAIEDALAGIQRCAKTSEADGRTLESLNNSLQLLTKMQFALLNNEQVRNISNG